jgi:pyruvate/2-oxoglutarate dehydrogenase complex dihydrolipoamide acyltransferase (E2) component
MRRIIVPQLAGETGRVFWKKQEGDSLAAGDVVLEVDLGYLKVPVKAQCAGRLGKRGVNEGLDVRGGATVAVIEDSDDAPKKAAWVSIECTFKCRSCGFVVPLNHVDMDGAILCARCGLEQALDVARWHDAFDFAHAVADRFVTSHRAVVDDETKLTLTAAGGEPTCPTCRAPYTIAIGDDRATARCTSCGTAVDFVVPAAAARMTKGALRAVIADEHRKDAVVQVEQTASAVAIQCPSCNAALDATGDSKFVTCKFCKTTSRIPNNVWFKLKGDVKPSAMWLAFEGESHARTDAERARQKRENDELVQHIRELKRQAGEAARVEARERARHELEVKEEREHVERAAHEATETAAKERADKRGVVIALVALALFFVLVMVAVGVAYH